MTISTNPNTFWSLISSQKIVIPVIQRDYAQGRPEVKNTRRLFLEGLYKSLCNSNPIELDFIYGSVDLSENGEKTFKPLDGQQRLTTLFLLHWYFATRYNLSEQDLQILGNFSYQTRISSRNFCEKLVANNGAFKDLAGKLSSMIRDMSWYLLSWDNDPTIRGMLAMLDAIQDKFHDINNGWTKLVSDELITFKFLNLLDFGLDDDLYIKMNARGVQINFLENLKAMLINKIELEGWEKTKHLDKTFAFKYDTIYTDIFWGIADKPEEIDSCMNNYLSAIVIADICRKGGDEAFDLAASIKKGEIVFTSDDIDKDLFDFIVQSLDNLSIFYHKNIKSSGLNLHNLKNNETKGNTDIIREICLYKSPSYPQIGLFYALSLYLNNVHVFQIKEFNDIYRVCRNICINGDVDQPSQLGRFIKSITPFCNGSRNVYLILEEYEKYSGPFSAQIYHEIEKSKIIISAPETKDLIFEAEDLEYCHGNISLLLKSTSFDGNLENWNYSKFEKHFEIVKKYLNSDLTNELRRLLLTCGDYKYYDHYWHSWSSPLQLQKRSLVEKLRYLWDACNNYDNFRQYIILMIKKLLYLEERNIILKIYLKDFQKPDEMENWKFRLITNPNLLDKYAQSTVFAIAKNGRHCYLFNGMINPNYFEQCKKVQ